MIYVMIILITNLTTEWLRLVFFGEKSLNFKIALDLSQAGHFSHDTVI
jgi:hypothetical protein